MPEMTDALDFQQKMKKMTDRELSEFACETLFELSKRVCAIESSDRKAAGWGGLVGGGIAAIGYVIMTLLKGKQ